MTSVFVSYLHTSSFPSSSSLPLFPPRIDLADALSTASSNLNLPSRSHKNIGISTRSAPTRSNGGGNAGADGDPNPPEDEELEDLGLRLALSMLRVYKREISPLLPSSCRFVPTCSEYSMEAYKKYGVIKGTVLTAWRLCRCNPLGGSGFDPPRWFDEKDPSEE